MTTTTISKQNGRDYRGGTAPAREQSYSGRSRIPGFASFKGTRPGNVAFDLDGATPQEPKTLSPTTVFVSGARAALPVSIGLLSLSVTLGDAAINNGFSALQVMALSALLLSAAAQLAVIDLAPSGASVAIVVFTVLIISLRLAVFSASLAPHFRTLPEVWKGPISYLLTDPAYAVSITHFDKNAGEPHKRWYFLGAALAIWITWQVGAVAGVFLGPWVPAGWSLDFLLPLTLIALIVPGLKDRATGVAALSAGGAAVFVAVLPLNLGLIAATLIGVLGGLIAAGAVERRSK